MILQRRLQVLIIEKGGVGQAGTDDALIAELDLGRIAALQVRHANEGRQQRAVGTDHREEALVGLDRGDDDRVRQAHEIGRQLAADRHRPFGQVHDLVEQVVRQPRAAPECRGRRLDLGPDALPTQAGIDQHPGLFERRLIVTDACQLDGRRMMETMTVAVATGAVAEQLQVQHVVAEQRDDPVHRSQEALLATAPAHRLGQRQRRHRLLDQRRQQRARIRTGLALAMHEPFALVAGDPLQRSPLDPAGLGETEQRAGGLTLAIQAGRHRRTTPLAVLIGLLERDCGDLHRQPARRPQRDAALGGKGDASLAQPLQQPVAQVLSQPGQAGGREFLATQFKQQISGGHGFSGAVIEAPPDHRSNG